MSPQDCRWCCPRWFSSSSPHSKMNIPHPSLLWDGTLKGNIKMVVCFFQFWSDITKKNYMIRYGQLMDYKLNWNEEGRKWGGLTLLKYNCQKCFGNVDFLRKLSEMTYQSLSCACYFTLEITYMYFIFHHLHEGSVVMNNLQRINTFPPINRGSD